MVVRQCADRLACATGPYEPACRYILGDARAVVLPPLDLPSAPRSVRRRRSRSRLVYDVKSLLPPPRARAGGGPGAAAPVQRRPPTLDVAYPDHSCELGCLPGQAGPCVSARVGRDESRDRRRGPHLRAVRPRRHWPACGGRQQSLSPGGAAAVRRAGGAHGRCRLATTGSSLPELVPRLPAAAASGCLPPDST